jgi:hypothetical protein
VWTALVGGPASAGPTEEEPLPGPACCPPPRSLDDLARLSWAELERLYRQAEPGSVPAGYVRGRAIYCPSARLAGTRSALTRLLWHGKHFRPDGTLVNQWTGARAVKARVFCGPSWLDGSPATVMDYSGLSHVWADVRDEIREVAPGLWLGVMFRRRCPHPKLEMFFALQAGPCASCR